MRVLRELLERRAVAVEVDVHLGVNVSADEPADGNEQRARERDRVVQRAEREVAVIKDQHGPEHTEHDVHTEPVASCAQRVHETQTLAQRIEQQDGHEARTDDTKPVAKAVLRIDEAGAACDPPATRHRERRERVTPNRSRAQTALGGIVGRRPGTSAPHFIGNRNHA